MCRIVITILAAPAFLLAAPAFASDLDCRFTHKILEISKVADLPAAIRADLPASLTDKGKPFGSGGDVYQPADRTAYGLLRAGRADTAQGARWFVAYAGNLLREDVRFYDVPDDKIVWVNPPDSRGRDLCTAFDALLERTAP